MLILCKDVESYIISKNKNINGSVLLLSHRNNMKGENIATGGLLKIEELLHLSISVQTNQCE